MMGVQLEREWDIVTSLIDVASDCRSGSRCWRGIDRWRALWEENKAWALPHLGPDGRLETKITVAPDRQCLFAALDAAYSVGTVIAAGPKYRDLFSNDATVDLAVRFLRYTASDAGIDVVAQNRFDSPVLDPMDDKKLLPAGTRFTKYLGRCLAGGREYHAVDLRKHLERYVMPRLPACTSLRSVLKQVTQFVTTVYSQIAQGMLGREVTVALSANPVDMVLASSHTTDWSSCHSIFEGCYATGPIDYLMDGSTLIAFAYRDVLPIAKLQRELGCEVPWPRKLWRQMVYFDVAAQGAVMSKEYPGVDEVYAREARSLAALLLSRVCGVSHDWKVGNADCLRDGDAHPDTDDYVYAGRRYVMHLNGQEWHYPDLPTRVVRMSPDGTLPHVYVGADDMICPACGAYRDCNSDETKHLLCSACADSYVCEECGERVDEDDAYEAPDNCGAYYCRDCYSQIYATCDCCNEDCPRDEMQTDAYRNILCSSCVDNYRYSCENCDELYMEEDIVIASDTGCAYCRDCAESLIEDGTLHRCSDCGEVFECEGNCEPVADNDEIYCRECVAYMLRRGHLRRCEHCDQLLASEDSVVCVDGQYYCHDCYPEFVENNDGNDGKRGEAA